MGLTPVKPEKVLLRQHPQFNEKWLCERIKEDPSILGLGDVLVKEVERPEPYGGRLDLLLYDTDSERRYEVELMLGTVDESHIIRCIEYWDLERRRYPQYEHAAVLVAENITTRFLNVIGLFNRAIPMIAIQLNALKVADYIVLNFTKVLDVVEPGEDDDDTEAEEETVDRGYWEKKGSKESLGVVDSCLSTIQRFAPNLSLKYNKFYIGLSDQVRPKNFVIFRPKRQFVRVEPKIRDRQKWAERLETAGIVVLPGGRTRLHFRLARAEAETRSELLRELLQESYSERGY